MTSAFAFLRNHYLAITALSGVVLITMGLLLFTGELKQLNIKAQEGLDAIGLNVFKEPLADLERLTHRRRMDQAGEAVGAGRRSA